MSDSNKETKSGWRLRIWILALSLFGTTMFVALLPLVDWLDKLLYRHGFQPHEMNALTGQLLMLGGAVSVLATLVLSIVGLFRRDWLTILFLVLALLAAVVVILALKGLSTGEI